MSTAVGQDTVADPPAAQQQEAPQDAADLFGGLKKKSGKKKKIPMDFDFDADTKKDTDAPAPKEDAPASDAPKATEDAPAPEAKEDDAPPAEDGALDVRAAHATDLQFGEMKKKKKMSKEW